MKFDILVKFTTKVVEARLRKKRIYNLFICLEFRIPYFTNIDVKDPSMADKY